MRIHIARQHIGYSERCIHALITSLLCFYCNNLSIFRWHLQFIKSDFHGQLPKPYESGADATSIIPSHMNDMNREEVSRYVSK